MNPTKVSVIIPVYNTEEYIGETLNSIINQTLRDIEIIVINDGSTDNSLQIINEYAQRDSRIIVFTQANQGQSIARNKGFDYASGIYIYFMDSDDILELNALELCYLRCENKNVDFIFFNANTIYESTQSDFQMNYHHFNLCDKIYNGITLLNYLLDTNQFFVPPYLNFIRKSYIENLNLRFYPHIIHEDQLYTTLLYINAKRILYINECLLNRRIRNASTMTNVISLFNFSCYITVFNQLNFFSLTQNKYIKQTIIKHTKKTLNAFIYNARNTSLNEKIAIIKGLLKHKYFIHLYLKSIIIFLFPFLSKIKKLFK